MPKRGAVLVVLAVLALSGSEARADEWMRLQSPHFMVVGDVGQRGLLSVARRLEDFREVIRRAFPTAKLVAPAPVTVVVFGRASDFKAVAQRFGGNPVEQAGYATTSPVGSSIAICVERPDQAYQVAYHEYAHVFISNAMRGLPLWLEEGLAEYYGTFELSDDRVEATLGKPIALDEIGLLRERLLPMPELLSADAGSKLYNAGTDRDRFYAQSWALVHYLLLGNPNRKRQFDDFLRRLESGVPAAGAFLDAFPDAGKLETELRAYIGQASIAVTRVSFADRVAGATEYTLSRMTHAESLAVLGFELAKQRRFEEAQARFEQALALAPGTASAQTGLGLVFALQGKGADALPALRRGVELADGDAMAHFAFGYGALECVSTTCPGEQSGRDTARREFQRAVDLLPQFPDALSLLGYAEAVTGGDLASAERHLLQAIDFLPGRDDYRLNLAQVYMRQENDAKAREMLDPVAASSPDAATKARARQMLGLLAVSRSARDARASESSPVQVDRQLGPGERRVQGNLAAVECRDGTVEVVIRDAAGPRRFSAPSLDTIEVIGHRNGLEDGVACGPQAGAMRVYLTWRAPSAGEPALAAGVEGRVVAIEFLPKEK